MLEKSTSNYFLERNVWKIIEHKWEREFCKGIPIRKFCLKKNHPFLLWVELKVLFNPFLFRSSRLWVQLIVKWESVFVFYESLRFTWILPLKDDNNMCSFTTKTTTKKKIYKIVGSFFASFLWFLCERLSFGGSYFFFVVVCVLFLTLLF